jgi:seryl-tRNA synthetase
LKALETNLRKDRYQQAMDNDLLMGEIHTLKQTVVKGEARINRLEKENKAVALVMKKVLNKVTNLNRDMIQVGES